MAQADGRAINEKVRLYARVGAALIAARDNKQDAFDAITAVIPWDRFLASVEEAEALARSEEFDAYQMLVEHYAGIRRWAPDFPRCLRLPGRAGCGGAHARYRHSARYEPAGRAHP